jgi:branched-chain amino acid transport system permease protein
MLTLSWLVYDTFLWRILREDEHNQILATLGLSILIVNLAMILWGPDARVMHAPDLLPPLRLGAITIPGNNTVIFIVGVLLVAGLVFFMKQTRYGLLLRLASDDATLAAYTGVNVNAMFRLSFIIGGFTAGVSGGLVALVLYVHPLVGTDLVIRAFAIVALGGLGSIGGSLIGAAILSAAESLVGTFVPGGGSWGYGIAFLLIVIVLAVRPLGLFGSEQRS